MLSSLVLSASIRLNAGRVSLRRYVHTVARLLSRETILIQYPIGACPWQAWDGVGHEPCARRRIFIFLITRNVKRVRE
jgi:hypothetical protein